MGILRASCVVCSLAAVIVMAGCQKDLPPSNAAAPSPPAFEPKVCHANALSPRPFVVEWAGSDRAELESALQRGAVVLKYSGCSMAVLPRCRAKVGVHYTATTPKRDHVRIKTVDELHASFPAHAFELEGRLKKAGELDVNMTIVGRWEADTGSVARRLLDGECEGATHVVTGASLGAFKFSTQAGSEAGASAKVLGAGAGASTSTTSELLNEDGNADQCNGAGDKAPPKGCAAAVRLDVAALTDASDPCACQTWSAIDFSMTEAGKVTCSTGPDCAQHYKLSGNACADPIGDGYAWCYVAKECTGAKPSADGQRSWRRCTDDESHCACLSWEDVTFKLNDCSTGTECAKRHGLKGNACADPTNDGKPWCFTQRACPLAKASADGLRFTRPCN